MALHPTRMQQVWFTDGTAAGTRPLTDQFHGGTARPRSLVVLDGGVLFEWFFGSGPRIWRLDPGVPTGTSPVLGFFPSMRAVGSRYAWFSATGTNGVQLWRTDGTGAGTREFADINPHGNSSPGQFCAVNGRMLFVANHADYGNEVWVLDTGALARSYGRGCSDRIVAPTLAATDPVLGGIMNLRGDSAVASATILLSLPLPGAATVVDPCRVYLSASALTSLITFPVAGSWELPVPLPRLAALQGLRLVTQAVFGPTSAPLGADLSNAVELGLGF